MAGPGAHGGERRTAEAGARVHGVHACRGGGGRVQVDIAAHGAHGAQAGVHGAGRGIHLEAKRNNIWLFTRTHCSGRRKYIYADIQATTATASADYKI